MAALVLIGIGLWATARPAGEFSGLDVRLAAAAGDVGHGGHITLPDATDFEWDEAHVFGSYSVAEDFEAQLDGWSPLSPAGRLVFGNLLLANDGLQLVAFRRGGEVVAWTVMNQEQLSQTYIEFDPQVLPRVAAPSDEFAVRRLGDRRLGDSWYLEPADEAKAP